MSDHKQQQFLDVIDRDEAERRFHSALRLQPLGIETVSLDAALDRIIAAWVDAPEEGGRHARRVGKMESPPE